MNTAIVVKSFKMNFSNLVFSPCRARVFFSPYNCKLNSGKRSRYYMTTVASPLQTLKPKQPIVKYEEKSVCFPHQLEYGPSYKYLDTFRSLRRALNHNYARKRALHYGAPTSKIPGDIPNPMEYESSAMAKKLHAQRFQISDLDGFLSEGAKQVIQGYINSSETELAVVLIRKMNNEFIKEANSNLNVAAERFARDLHDTWGVGDASKNDGVLIFFSIDDRVVFFSTGNGVKDLFDEKVIDSILSEMRKYLKNGNYDSAVEYAVLQVHDIIKYKHSFWRSRRNKEKEKLIGYLIAAAIIAFALIQASRDGDKREIEMDRAKRENQLIAAEKEVNRIFDTNEDSCPYCLETYEPDKKTKIRLECGHLFCLQCFNFMKENGVPGTLGSCAICGKPLIEKMVVEENVSDSDETPPVPLEADSEEVMYRLNRFQDKHHVTFDSATTDSVLEQIRENASKAKETIKEKIKEEIAKERHEYILQRMEDREQREAARKSGQSGSSRDSFSGGKSSGGHGGGW